MHSPRPLGLSPPPWRPSPAAPRSSRRSGQSCQRLPLSLTGVSSRARAPRRGIDASRHLRTSLPELGVLARVQYGCAVERDCEFQKSYCVSPAISPHAVTGPPRRGGSAVTPHARRAPTPSLHQRTPSHRLRKQANARPASLFTVSVHSLRGWRHGSTRWCGAATYCASLWPPLQAACPEVTPGAPATRSSTVLCYR